jgi:hypothetical protein
MEFVIRSDDGAGGLHEQHRFLGHVEPAFSGMVGIVEADTDEFAYIAHTGANALSGRELGQARHIDSRDPGKTIGRQHIPGNVAHDTRKVTDRAIFGQDGRLLSTLGADTEQFHCCLPYGFYCCISPATPSVEAGTEPIRSPCSIGPDG